MNKSAGDMLTKGLFPNGKEITESMGAYYALKFLANKINIRLDNTCLAVCVGDGSTPRTGGLLAFRTKIDCLSIDPNLRDFNWEIDRLSCVRSKVEDVNYLFYQYNHVFIVMVHSHAPLKPTLEHIRTTQNRHLIVIPCCDHNQILSQPGYVYRDNRIESPMNLVYIWDNVK